jgi:transcriptional regulator with XRE-family HTH domain
MTVQANTCKTPIQVALEQCPLSNIELAFRVGVDLSTIWRWKTGKSIPTSQAIREALADVLRRQVAELFPPEALAA